MNPIKAIRTRVFNLTQVEFATIAGVQQSTVSRWENGVAPTLDEMQAIRSAAATKKMRWSDEWFFTPAPERRAKARAA
jgi:transcriptional regulator with XRE-family HTH domain